MPAKILERRAKPGSISLRHPEKAQTNVDAHVDPEHPSRADRLSHKTTYDWTKNRSSAEKVG